MNIPMKEQDQLLVMTASRNVLWGGGALRLGAPRGFPKRAPLPQNPRTPASEHACQILAWAPLPEARAAANADPFLRPGRMFAMPLVRRKPMQLDSGHPAAQGCGERLPRAAQQLLSDRSTPS